MVITMSLDIQEVFNLNFAARDQNSHQKDYLMLPNVCRNDSSPYKVFVPVTYAEEQIYHFAVPLVFKKHSNQPFSRTVAFFNFGLFGCCLDNIPCLGVWNHKYTVDIELC